MTNLISKENNEKSGVYIIKNSINSKVYIGSTLCFRTRYNQHVCDIKRNKHNQRLLNFVKVHGINTLVFDVLEFVEPDKLAEREQYYIDFYQSYKSKKGYNICPKAHSILGRKDSEETKKKKSLRMMGNTITKGMKFSKEKGEKIKDYWKNNPDALEKMKQKNRESQLKVDRTKFKKGKIIDVYFNNQLIDTVESLKEVCKKYNLSHSSASRVLQGKLEKTKGYKLISKGFYFKTK